MNQWLSEQARSKLGLSIESWARLLAVKYATVREWERGKRNPGHSARSLMQAILEAPAPSLELRGRLASQLERPGAVSTAKAQDMILSMLKGRA